MARFSWNSTRSTRSTREMWKVPVSNGIKSECDEFWLFILEKLFQFLLIFTVVPRLCVGVHRYHHRRSKVVLELWYFSILRNKNGVYEPLRCYRWVWNLVNVWFLGSFHILFLLFWFTSHIFQYFSHSFVW